jgi:hypothetical protein
MTQLVFPYRFMAYLAARRCTISSFLIDLILNGFQIEAQYSKFGLTSEKYAADLIS